MTNYITTFVNQESLKSISFPKLPRMSAITQQQQEQPVQETIITGLVCAVAIVLLRYMVLDTYRTYQRLCRQWNRRQPPVSILRRPEGGSRKKNRSWFGVFIRKPNRVRFAKIFRRTFVPNKHELQSRRECWGLIQWRIQLHDEVLPEIENTVRFVPHTPVSILRPSRQDWGSPKPTSSIRVHFAPKTRRRNFLPDEQDLQSRRQLVRQIDRKIKRRNARRWKIDFKRTVLATIVEDPAEEDLSNIDSSLDTGFIDGKVDSEIIAIALENHRQMLPTVLHDMLSNIPVPMDLDDDDNNNKPCMEEQAPLSLKRIATSCLISSRPTKRRKMNSSSTVPTCAATWAKRTNELFTPLLPVIIEDPEEDGDESHIESSLDAGFNDDIANEPSTRLAKVALENHRQMLPTVLHDMLSNIPVPMDLDDDDNNNKPCMEEQAPLSLKRIATSCLISSRPTKRRKMNSSSTVPTCAATWAKRTNELFTPLLPVIIEDPEEDGDESHIESSLDAGFNDDIANEPSTRLAKADAIWVNKSEEILAEKANLNKMTKAERAKWANKARARRSKGQKEIDFEPTLLVIIEDPIKEEEEDEVDDVNEKKEFKPSLHVIIEDPEGEDLSTIDESPLDAALINDDFDSLEDGSDGEIFAAPTEQSDNARTTDIPSDGMGSGWTESGKRYSRRLQLKLSPEKKDPSTEALGSDMTKKGRRYSRRVVNRGKGAN
ncbi:unnamed protein product [Cylindrotheca closterium]|uniref:Uncharacterized protein n=1 Tax=Cylindrotheca closterium TaxID=2856 RepID=A0AAD2FMJ2_9STRA|nr:unnamed protein product [Cylindrotheca closterium]CAJ1945866.1 unnamed protein product [Cylindrotheca closterium]